jgi:hypothetical protein
MHSPTKPEIERERRLQRQARARARVARQPDAYRPMTKRELTDYLKEVSK